MKLKSIFLSVLSAMFMSMGASAQGDYYVKHGADVTVNHGSHYPIMVGVSNVRGDQQKLNGIASAPRCQAYFDKTSTVFEVKSGETVTPLIAINGSWMHGYVYVDWNNNKQFDVNISGDGPYVKEEGNELMCWSLYAKNGDGNSGWNSAGLNVSGDVLAPGSFRVPEGLEVGSTYRMRYCIMWNCIDPTGASYANYISDGASIIDVTLKISGVASGDEVYEYPINEYTEPRLNTTPDAASWNALPDGLIATWGSRDVHYKLHEVPQITQKNIATLYAWKGERANIQAVLYSKTDQGTLSVRMTEWEKNGVATGINKAGEARFVNYVITDDFTSCGNNSMGYPTWLVADVIDQDKPHAVPAMETRPVWCTLEIPREIEAGEYTTKLEIVNADNQVVKSLNLNIIVDSHSLPTVAEQKFHLDFWQQPYAVSRYYGVERWSDEHLEALRPYLAALGRAGQRVVSAILFYEPWGEQTHDLFDPMVQTTKKSNGTWEYDYEIFDKYVELCAEYGINKQINCFSMLPWDMSFRYFDEASSSYKTLTTTYESTEYRELWTNFLTAFKAHLQQKGWFEKTVIAVDERGEAAMLKAYEIANGLGFKMALAGNYHSSLCDILHDKCVQLGQEHYITAAQLANRKAKNRVTTFYTSCANSEPNIYTNSYPAEAAYLPIYAAKMNLDGYLHWAWCNWDEDPLIDSRYRKFGSGDTYCYYPGNRSSVRFERLIEGIHQYEKVQILREEYNDNPDKLYKLNTLLGRFTGSVAGEECAALVDDLEAFLNGLEVEVPEPPTIATGYYHMISKATDRREHLYNDATHTGNDNRLTLQSDAMVNTNNGIWYITSLGGGKVGIKNGDGNPIVAGGSGASLMGSYTQLTIASTQEANSVCYYYFDSALNCANSSYSVNGVHHLTTWAAGPATANDNLWRFEPVSVEGKTIYEIEVDHKDGYVVYNNGTTVQNAFDGGFFITDGAITEAQLSAAILGNDLKDGASIAINGNTITLSGVKPRIVKQDLYNTSKGDGVIPPYRIPGITTANNGRLITAAARLVCGTDPGFGQVDVVCRTSDNNGETWSDMIEVAVGTGEESAERNIFETAFGDPAIVADRTSSEVLVIAVAGCTQYGHSKTTRQNPNMIATIHSTDNGNTWGTPVDVTEPIYSLFDSGNPMQAAFVGGGKVFQSRIVKKDKYYRLYAAMCARPNGNRVIYSDDFGRTWHALGGASALPAPGGDEPKCEELPDGRVILSSRATGGRIYNIYTYTNTLTAEGSWEGHVMSTFEGAGHSAGGNSTNGEILIVPVVRNSDNSEMYLALQSLPTGSGRSNVGIFYKELADASDINSVNALATGWDGFFEVTTKSSAYSSMDLQADNRIGFIYEETLTGWGKRDNPVSTCFPNGEGQHNFDGFDNIYVAYDLEYLTGGAYSIKRNVDRREYIRNYFTAITADASDETKAVIAKALDALSPEPTTQQIDNLYNLKAVAEDGDATWYYIRFQEKRSSSNFAVNSWAYFGDNLRFSATQLKSDTQLWRTIPTGEGTYHIVSKTGKYLVPASSITTSSTQPTAAWTIEDSETQGLKVIYNGSVPCQMHALKTSALTNWGYDSQGTGTGARKNDSGCNFEFVEAAKISDLTVFDADAGKVGYYTDDVIATYKEAAAAAMTAEQIAAAKAVVFASTERNMPVSGKAYTFKNVQKDGTTVCWFVYNPSTGLIETTTTEANATPFVCRLLANGKYVFVCNDGKYMTWRGGDTGNTGVRDTYDNTAAAYTDVTISKMTTGGNITGDLSNTCYVNIYARRNANGDGCVIIKKSDFSFDKSSAPYYTDAYSSAIIMEEATYANTPKLNSVGQGELLSEDLHNTYMATFSAPFPTVTPEGVVAYFATKDNEYVILNAIAENEAIPANTGVILVATENGNAVMLPAADETTATIDSNLFGHSAGADKSMNGVANAYLLTNGAQGVGFYRCSGGTLSANKSYLQLESAQQSLRMRIGDNTTGIESPVLDSEESMQIYDLMGRRVKNPEKGIYIVNGKKVIK